MDELDLYTVNVFRVTNNKNSQEDRDSDSRLDRQQPSLTECINFIEKHYNMTSAKVMGGRTVELEHYNLAGPAVKFKTVVNFDRILDPDISLGVLLVPQDGYITKTKSED